MNRKTLALLFVAVTASSATSQFKFWGYIVPDLCVLDAYSCDKNGKRHTPKVGDDYWVAVKYQAVGSIRKKFHIEFKLANVRKARFVSTLLSSGTYSERVNFGRLNLDDTIPIQVRLDFTGLVGELSERNNTIRRYFTPEPPSRSIEYLEPRNLLVTQTMRLRPERGKITRMRMMGSKPMTGSWQRVLSSTCRVFDGQSWRYIGSRSANQAYHPVYYWEKKNFYASTVLMFQRSKVRVSNVRVNPTRLRTTTWAQIDAVQRINAYKEYTLPTSVLQSRSPEVGLFVLRTLGSRYRQTMKPYDAARKLFKAVVRHLHYTTVNTADSAVEAIKTRRGDCGTFSLLFVACCQRVGIPARVACGYWGGGASHCWSEFFLPGHGWVLCDGSAANTADPTGQFAHFFGVLFDLNNRYAVMRGNNFRVGDFHRSWLQGMDALIQGPKTTRSDYNTVVATR